MLTICNNDFRNLTLALQPFLLSPSPTITITMEFIHHHNYISTINIFSSKVVILLFKNFFEQSIIKYTPTITTSNNHHQYHHHQHHPPEQYYISHRNISSQYLKIYIMISPTLTTITTAIKITINTIPYLSSNTSRTVLC